VLEKLMVGAELGDLKMNMLFTKEALERYDKLNSRLSAVPIFSPRAKPNMLA
jgi:hypothetical protein